MRRWAYFGELAYRDFVRLWSSTQHHVIIIAGIVLPLLLLLGLKRGNVAELRAELLKTPTARQIAIWSGLRSDLLMTSSSLESLQRDAPEIEMIIPDSERVMDLANPGKPSTAPVSMTMYASRPGDPLLAQAGCELSEADPYGVVVSTGLAEKLEIKVGDTITATIHRTTRGGDQSATTSVRVVGTLAQQGQASDIGYVDFRFLDQCEQWVRGFKVESLSWPAAADPVPARYGEYLLFTEGTLGLADDDRKTLNDRGFVITEVRDDAVKTLFNLLNEESKTKLGVWRLTPEGSTIANPVFLPNTGSDIETVTSADDVVLPWPAPRRTSLDAPLFVGVSLKKRSWLRQYLREPFYAFEPVVDGPQVIQVGQQSNDEKLSCEGCDIPLDIVNPAGEESAGGADFNGPAPGLRIVPVQLLARLEAFERGDAVYDASLRLFVEVPRPAVYGKARAFVATIDQVPAAVDWLVDRGFSVMSESGRISEVHKQDSSLQLLVWVVGLGVFLFGIVTVFSVLVDSTDRKRGVLGILRVMGMSQGGVFAMVLLRAAAIGIIAGLVAVVSGFAIASFLDWSPPATVPFAARKPQVSIILGAGDILVVLVGAVLCAAIGALLPAWKASRLDPFDAIIEGRFT
jgi:hypothetical protein